VRTAATPRPPRGEKRGQAALGQPRHKCHLSLSADDGRRRQRAGVDGNRAFSRFSRAKMRKSRLALGHQGQLPVLQRVGTGYVARVWPVMPGVTSYGYL
jgi:hypothetical protein